MVAYINKLLPYQLSSIEEECAVSSCTSSLESKNMELHASLKHLTAVFNKLDSYIELLAAQSKTPQTFDGGYECYVIQHFTEVFLF